MVSSPDYPYGFFLDWLYLFWCFFLTTRGNDEGTLPRISAHQPGICGGKMPSHQSFDGFTGQLCCGDSIFLSAPHRSESTRSRSRLRPSWVVSTPVLLARIITFLTKNLDGLLHRIGQLQSMHHHQTFIPVENKHE